MCGIVGYIGQNKALDRILNGLEKLEYRGYDSCGIAIKNSERITLVKEKGRLENFKLKIGRDDLDGNIGIGHTRWATHGEPSSINSHPHTDEKQDIFVVHNGIIENYKELKEDLLTEGYPFYSETDTEIIPNLIAKYYNGSLLNTVKEVLPLLKGSFSLAIIDKREEIMIATRRESPLLIGLSENEFYAASDASAIIEYTNKIIYPEDGDIVLLEKDNMTIFDNTLTPLHREVKTINWTIDDAGKEGFDHFMLKEIFEQPKALYETFNRRLKNNRFSLEELSYSAEYLYDINKVYIVACGTAYHAGLVGKNLMEKSLHIPVIPDIASEFRYMERYLDDRSLVIIISQSGETADTLAALRKAKQAGSSVLAITNVMGSSIAREADQVLFTWAGPEIAVASTKAYTTQLISLYMIAMYFGSITNYLSDSEYDEIVNGIKDLPSKMELLLQESEKYANYCKELIHSNSCFFIGRGIDSFTAMEGALKLKEVSYIHAESFAAGELKHGTIALIEQGTPIIALATQEFLKEKMVSNIREVRTRGASILGIAMEGISLGDSVDRTMTLPKTIEILSPFLSVIPLQFIAYYSSILKGNDVDKPRNLAKSVTVE